MGLPGLQRYVDVLNLFDVDAEAWTIQAMAGALSVPASTVYRTARDLVRAGLLDPAGDSRYRLGVAFIAFDRKIRLTDPLIIAGQPVLRDIVRQAHVACVGLLCRLYEGQVMCIANETTGNAGFESSYERGRPMPLIQGATSKVILAQLPARRLAKLLGQCGQSEDPAALREALAEVRRRGYAVASGEIDQGLMGLAAPVTCPSLGLVASLSVVVRAADVEPGLERRLVMLLIAAAALLTEQLDDTHGRRRAAG